MSNNLRNPSAALNPFPVNERNGLLDAFGRNLSVYKTVTQSVVSSTVIVNDAELSIALPSGRHQLQLFAPLGMAAAGNIQFQFTAPDGLTANTIGLATFLNLNATAPQVLNITAIGQTITGGAASAWSSLLIMGSIDVKDAGTLLFRWAQNASSATPTQVLVGAVFQSYQIKP